MPADLANILEDQAQSTPPQGNVLGPPSRSMLRMLREPSAHRRFLQDLGLAGLDDPLFSQQWGMPAVNASGAWNVTRGGLDGMV